MSIILREATQTESATMTGLEQGYMQMAANTLELLLNPDYIAIFKTALPGDPYLPCSSVLVRGRHISLVRHREGLREMLQHHRNDPNGFFICDREAYKKILNEIFPEYDLTQNDIILFCDKDHSENYRALILKHLEKPPAETISEIAEQELSQWTGSVSLNRTNSFASSVLSRLLLGESTPFEAIDVFNEGMSRRAMGLQGSNAYNAALKEIHDTIERTLATSTTPFIQELKQSDFTPAQQRYMIFTLFFAGQETTASALTYMIWDLALHPEKQAEIFAEIQGGSVSAAVKKSGNYPTIQKIISMGLFKHPPVPAFARTANKDLVMDFGDVKRFIPKGRQLNACPIFATDKEPKHTPTNYPFSSGPNNCPGQYLARMEMRLFLIALIKKFRFSTNQTEVKQVCRITMKLQPEIYIQVEPREPTECVTTPAHGAPTGGAMSADPVELTHPDSE